MRAAYETPIVVDYGNAAEVVQMPVLDSLINRR